MRRMMLSRVGACSAVLGGFILSIVAAVSLATILSPTTGWTPSTIMSGWSIALFAVLGIASLIAPVALLASLLGLYALLGWNSPAAKWGLVASAAAMLILFALSAHPYSAYLYFQYIGDPNPSPNPNFMRAIIFLSSVFYVVQALLLAGGFALLFVEVRRRDVLGPWRPLLPAIGILAILENALLFVGTSSLSTISEAFALVLGLLWMVLGVAICRHAPSAESRLANATPASP